MPITYAEAAYHKAIRPEKQASLEAKYKKKIAKYKKFVKVLRELLNQLNVFMYDLKKKPSGLSKIEKEIVIVTAKLPKLTDKEICLYANKEYALVKKYMICIACKRDLLDLRVNNENIEERIVCNDCGTSFYKNVAKDKRKSKSKEQLHRLFGGLTDDLIFGDDMVNPYLEPEVALNQNVAVATEPPIPEPVAEMVNNPNSWIRTQLGNWGDGANITYGYTNNNNTTTNGTNF